MTAPPLLSTSPDFDELLAAARSQANLPAQRYFRALETASEGALSRADFVETQVQFLFAVVGFAAPMRALSERLPDGPARRALLDNVRDEAGDGDPRASHEATFLALLHALGEDRAAIDRRALSPAVRTFNAALLGVASHDDPTIALGTLGMIEDCFAVLSARLGQAIAARGFLPADAIVHYAVHETLDHTHAEGFFSPLRTSLAETPAGPSRARLVYFIEQGLGLGAHLLLGLYDALFDARHDRPRRVVDGDHGGVNRLSVLG